MVSLSLKKITGFTQPQRLKRDYVVAEPPQKRYLCFQPKPAKAIGPPHLYMAQDYIKNIDEGSREELAHALTLQCLRREKPERRKTPSSKCRKVHISARVANPKPFVAHPCPPHAKGKAPEFVPRALRGWHRRLSSPFGTKGVLVSRLFQNSWIPQFNSTWGLNRIC